MANENLQKIFDKMQDIGLISENIQLEPEEVTQIQQYLAQMINQIYDFRASKTAEIEAMNRQKELERITEKTQMGPVFRRDEIAKILTFTKNIQDRRMEMYERPEVPEEMHIIKDEINVRNIRGTEYIEYAVHYSLPAVTKQPGFAEEAYAFIQTEGLADDDKFKRIYFSQKQGYIAVLTKLLVPKEDQFFFETKISDSLNGWADI